MARSGSPICESPVYIRAPINSNCRTVLFGNARVITADPLIGDFESGDVLLGGSRIVVSVRSC